MKTLFSFLSVVVLSLNLSAAGQDGTGDVGGNTDGNKPVHSKPQPREKKEKDYNREGKTEPARI